MTCRHCGNDALIAFADLQNAPLSNAMIEPDKLFAPEVFYPLVVQVCDRCFLAQVLGDQRPEDIFDSNYTYFSSYSRSWLQHAERFAHMAVERFELGPNSRVVEIASNDGYLLQYFRARDIPVVGVEPTANTAAVATAKGISTIVEFFGKNMARERLGASADLIIGNNVYAHVPDINDFTAGLKAALKPTGLISLEFPHLLQLIEHAQFDTIYHEHFSYLSLGTTQAIFSSQGLKVVDVEELPTHGGSLRIFGAHEEDESKTVSPSVAAVLQRERQAGLFATDTYGDFQPRIDRIRAELLQFLLEQRAGGKKVAAYGAAAKGNTLLNYCGVKGDELIRFVCDVSPHKQGKHLPGSHINVFPPNKISEERPDFIILFPWNLREEIMEQLAPATAYGARFVTAIPELRVW